MSKYVKPGSLTWWGGVLVIAQGALLLAQGELQEGLLVISGGLTAIGLRAAVPTPQDTPSEERRSATR